MKVCIICKVEKPYEAFNKGKCKGGRHAYCRECQKSYHEERKKK
jgi:hypothetical protein